MKPSLATSSNWIVQRAGHHDEGIAGAGFDEAKRPVPVTQDDASDGETPRQRFEDALLDEGLPFEIASSAGEIFAEHLRRESSRQAASMLKSFLQLLENTKLGRTVQFIALKKLISPDSTYESLCAGTKHTKQKVHYHVTQFRQNFYRKPIGED